MKTVRGAVVSKPQLAFGILREPYYPQLKHLKWVGSNLSCEAFIGLYSGVAIQTQARDLLEACE